MIQAVAALADPQARARVGLFFALFPPPGTAQRIAELGRQLQIVHRLAGSVTAQDRLHCSLHGVAAPKRNLAKPNLDWAVIRAREAASRLHAAPFDVAFDRTASFGKFERHFVLIGERDDAGLKAFRGALRTALYHAELADGTPSQFTPHVTLLYGGDRTIAEHPVTPIRWRVETFALVLSMHGEGHRLLGRWTLGG